MIVVYCHIFYALQHGFENGRPLRSDDPPSVLLIHTESCAETYASSVASFAACSRSSSPGTCVSCVNSWGGKARQAGAGAINYWTWSDGAETQEHADAVSTPTETDKVQFQVQPVASQTSRHNNYLKQTGSW